MQSLINELRGFFFFLFFLEKGVKRLILKNKIKRVKRLLGFNLELHFNFLADNENQKFDHYNVNN